MIYYNVVLDQLAISSWNNLLFFLTKIQEPDSIWSVTTTSINGDWVMIGEL